jgi:hypothetical protein
VIEEEPMENEPGNTLEVPEIPLLEWIEEEDSELESFTLVQSRKKREV